MARCCSMFVVRGWRSFDLRLTKHVTHFSKNGMNGVNCCNDRRLCVPFSVPRWDETRYALFENGIFGLNCCNYRRLCVPFAVPRWDGEWKMESGKWGVEMKGARCHPASKVSYCFVSFSGYFSARCPLPRERNTYRKNRWYKAETCNCKNNRLLRRFSCPEVVQKQGVWE